MEIATPVGNLAAAPTSTDNNTVILWVVCVLFVGLAVAVAVIYRTFTVRHVECQETGKKAWEKVEEKDAKILELHEGLIAEGAKREADAQQLISRNTEAFSDLKGVINGLSSGRYTANRNNGG